jgi:hypothetical protein
MFATQFNCTFAQRKGTVITIYVDGKLERHDELAYQTIQLQEDHSHVTV